MAQQQQTVWGIFDEHAATHERLRDTVVSNAWSQAVYSRLPEGIVLGFAGGGLLCALICVLASRGLPPVFPAAVFICIGSVAGTILGAFAGVIVARLESRRMARENRAKFGSSAVR